MYHDSWTVRDGAPASISNLIAGPDGFLWIAASEGIYRFDGVSFKPVDLPLPNAQPYLVRSTPDGSVWIFYSYGTLVRIKNNQVTTLTVRDGLQDQLLSNVIQKDAQSFWLSGDGGVQTIKQSPDGALLIEAGPSISFIHSMSSDTDGIIWISTKDALLVAKPSQNTPIKVADLVDGHTFCRADIATGVLCKDDSSGGSVFRWKWQDGRPIKDLLIDQIAPVGFFTPGDGTVWVGTEQGIVRIKIQGPDKSRTTRPEMESLLKREGLTGNTIWDFDVDREGSIWTVSSGGIDRFREAAFSRIEIAGARRVQLPHGESDSHVVLATDRLIDVSTGNEVAVTPQIDDTLIRSLYRSADGTLWIGTRAGFLFHFLDGKLVPHATPPDTADCVILAIAEDGDRSLWISVGQGKGVFRFDGATWRKNDATLPFPTGSPSFIESDHTGGLWFGYRENQLAHLSAGALRVFDSKNGLGLGNLKVIVQQDNNVWIGGDNGVALLAENIFYPLAFDRKVRGVSGLTFSSDGAMWINTVDGVIRVDQNDLKSKAIREKATLRSRLFDNKDGLEGTPDTVAGFGSAWIGPNGRLYIAAREFLHWIDPLHLPRNTTPPQVWITGITTDGSHQPSLQELFVARPNVGTLQIDYAATSLLIPSRVSFRYQLEGYDRDWIDAGTRRQAFYAKLPPAEYVFRVTASNDSGVWNETGASLRLKVLPAFTQTVIFKALCLLVLLLAAWLIYRLRIMQLSRQLSARMYTRLAERERIARDLHDTFFQGVQGLLLTINSATRQMPQNDPIRPLFEDALAKSDNVMSEGRDLVLNLRNHVTSNQDLAALLNEWGKELTNASSVSFRVTVIGEARPLQAAAMDELYWLGREALTNAFRHSTAEAIEVEVSYDKADVCLRIRDNGSGIDSEILKQGRRENHFGLQGMSERARKLGAQLQIWSSPNAGTEIEIRIAAILAYETNKADFRARLSRLFFSKLSDHG